MIQRSIAHSYGQDGNSRKVMLQNSQLGIIGPEVCEIHDDKVRLTKLCLFVINRDESHRVPIDFLLKIINPTEQCVRCSSW